MSIAELEYRLETISIKDRMIREELALAASRVGVHIDLVPSTRPSYPTSYGVLAVAAVALLVVGVAVGTVWPGPATGFLVPLALTLWWIVYKLANAYDSRR
jgi:hypothetical protein